MDEQMGRPPFALTMRIATAADAPALAEFARRTFHEAYVAVMEPELLERVLAEQFGPDRQRGEIEDPTAAWIVAEVGWCARRIRVPPDRTDAGNRHARGAGRGGALLRGPRMARPRRCPAAHGCRRLSTRARLGGRTLWLAVWQRNPRAIAFYLKYGFVRAGVCSWEQTPGALEDDLMMLDLVGAGVPA